MDEKQRRGFSGHTPDMSGEVQVIKNQTRAGIATRVLIDGALVWRHDSGVEYDLDEQTLSLLAALGGPRTSAGPVMVSGGPD